MITPAAPPKYVMLGNQIPLTLTTNQYIQVTGQNAMTDVVFNGHLPNGQLFTLQWMAGDISLQFKVTNTPTASAGDIPRNTNVTYQVWVSQVLLPALQAHPLLSSVFQITNPTTGIIRFEALQPGPLFSISLPVAHASMNVLNVQNGVAPVYDEQLRILLRLQFKKLNSPSFQNLEYRVSPNAGKTSFLINELLSLDDVDVPLPDINSNAPQDVSNGMLEFKLSYTEIFGQSLLSNKLQQGNGSHYAFAGGLKESDYPSANFQSKFDSYYNWLTWYPHQISIAPGQPFLLHWFAPANGANFELYTTVTFTDGTTQNRPVYTVVNGNKHKVWCCPVGSAILNQFNFTKEVQSYKLWWFTPVLNGSTLRSPYITITLDRKKYRDETYLLYRNSWGFFEVARLTGVRETSAIIQSEEHIRQLPFNYTASDRSGRNMGSSYQLIDTLYSGFRQKGEMNHLLDLLRSEDIRIIEGDKVRPVILEPDNIAMYDTESGRQNAASFKIKDQSTGKYYSDGRYSA